MFCLDRNHRLGTARTPLYMTDHHLVDLDIGSFFSDRNGRGGSSLTRVVLTFIGSLDEVDSRFVDCLRAPRVIPVPI
jgi:hypothetical protein